MDETLRRDTMHDIRETLDSKIQYDSIIFGLESKVAWQRYFVTENPCL